MEPYLVIGLLIVGVAIVVVAAILVVGRASSRRDQLRHPLDPESLDAMRAAQKESTAMEARRESNRFGDGIEF